MKPIAIISCFFLFLLTACTDTDKQTNESKSESDMDAARNFLDAALKGNYKGASSYMLQDSTNLGYLTVTERSYQRLNPDEKNKLKSASLRFFDTKQINDSITITVFANSYKNDKDTLKIVRKNGQWLIDLKYLFEHDLDTFIYKQNNKTDTIHK